MRYFLALVVISSYLANITVANYHRSHTETDAKRPQQWSRGSSNNVNGVMYHSDGHVGCDRRVKSRQKRGLWSELIEHIAEAIRTVSKEPRLVEGIDEHFGSEFKENIAANKPRAANVMFRKNNKGDSKLTEQHTKGGNAKTSSNKSAKDSGTQVGTSKPVNADHKNLGLVGAEEKDLEYYDHKPDNWKLVSEDDDVLIYSAGDSDHELFGDDLADFDYPPAPQEYLDALPTEGKIDFTTNPYIVVDWKALQDEDSKEKTDYTKHIKLKGDYAKVIDSNKKKDDPLRFGSPTTDLDLEKRFSYPPIKKPSESLAIWLYKHSHLPLEAKMKAIIKEVDILERYHNRTKELEVKIIDDLCKQHPNVKITQYYKRRIELEGPISISDILVEDMDKRQTRAFWADYQILQTRREQIKNHDPWILKTINGHIPQKEFLEVDNMLSRFRKENLSWLLMWGI